ncbi:MAG: glycosyl transferase, group 1 [Bryobacterales bacterium]|nr:glycosyl transferase, group 1 [Bryobacterales bacterium]
MKACMIAYAFYDSDNRVRRYAECLAARGDVVDAIALRGNGQAKESRLKGVTVSRIQARTRNEKGPFSYLFRLLAFFIRSTVVLTLRHLSEPYDVIHVHSVPDFQVFCTLIPRLLGARVILDLHDIVPEFYASKFGVDDQCFVFRALLRVEKMSTRFADHVIISNDLWRGKLVQRSVPAAKCSSIINYPDPGIFHTRERRNLGSGFVICYPGTLNHHQGVDLAVRAMADLRDSEAKLLVVGDGPDRAALIALATQLGVNDRVFFLGTVPLEEVARIMSAVDLGIVPKRADGFGNEAFSTKILEFMACGVPVLAARTKIDTHYFNDELVQFFEPGDVQDLAARIRELTASPRRCAYLRRQSLQFVAGNNWGVRKSEYLELVDHLVSSSGCLTQGA